MGKRFNGFKDGTKTKMNRKMRSVKERAQYNYDTQKSKIQNSQTAKNLSNLNNIRQTRGLKGKTKAFGHYAANTRIGSKVVNAAKRMARFIRTNIVLIKFIAIGFLVALFLTLLILFGISLAQAYAPTPHYYCDPQASEEVKSSKAFMQYCRIKTNADNSSIAAAAVSLATTDTTVGGKQIDYTGPGFGDVEAFKGRPNYKIDTFVNVTKQITELSRTRPGLSNWGISYFASCDLNTGTAVLWSGADDEFPLLLIGAEEERGGTSGIAGYLTNNTNGKWEELERGSDIQPGDIAIGGTNQHGGRGVGHVWMYVANWENGAWTDNSIVQEVWPGSTANRFEGSHKDYYSRLTRDGDPWKGAKRIFRFVGEPNEASIFSAVQP